MKHIFIVNPYAGSMTFANNLRRQLEKIEGFEYFLFNSRYTGNETELTKVRTPRCKEVHLKKFTLQFL